MKTVIISKDMPSEAVRRLELSGFEVMKLASHPKMPSAIAAHPDSLLLKVGNRIFADADYCEVAPYIFTDLAERYPRLEFSFTEDEVGDVYPKDSRHNAIVRAGYMIANEKNLCRAAIGYAKEKGLIIKPVKQGYPACTTLVGDGFAITADRGIERAISECGFDVLSVSAGGIRLDPYEYGFIGGASAVIGRTVYFFGDLYSHPDGRVIESFIESHGMRAVSLFSSPLVDLGGALVIQDEADGEG